MNLPYTPQPKCKACQSSEKFAIPASWVRLCGWEKWPCPYVLQTLLKGLARGQRYHIPDCLSFGATRRCRCSLNKRKKNKEESPRSTGFPERLVKIPRQCNGGDIKIVKKTKSIRDSSRAADKASNPPVELFCAKRVPSCVLLCGPFLMLYSPSLPSRKHTIFLGV